MRTTRRVAILLMALVLIAAGCSNDDKDSKDGSQTTSVDSDKVASATSTSVVGTTTTTVSADSAGYGDIPELDALYEACRDGFMADCDTLYINAPAESRYEAFGANCGDRERRPGVCAVPKDSGPYKYGDDPSLDALWDACEEGEMGQCDALYDDPATPYLSEYWQFAATCGERFESPRVCGDDEVPEDAMNYGDDDVLDALYDRCKDGDMPACDDLFRRAPADSDYEAFGLSCGKRTDGTELCVEEEPGKNTTTTSK